MPLLSIDIEANYARFQDAMSAIERTAKKSAVNLQSAFQSVNGTLAGLGVSISAGGLAALVKSSVDAADHLNDLSKKTGITVETLGGIGFAAVQAGSNLDSVAGAIGKLNKTIAEAGSGNREAVEAFQALRVSIEEVPGRLKTADRVLAEIADRFEGFADGPEKAAIALRLFGKAGTDIIPLLDDGGEALRRNIDYFQQYAGVTQDIAEKSDAFNDTLEKIHLLSGAAGNQIAAELLPTLQILAEKMLEVKESSDGFSGVGRAIRTVIEAITVLGLETKFTFKTIGEELGGTAAQLAALARLDFKGFATIGEEMAEGAAKARAENDKLIEDLLHPKPAGSGGQVPNEIAEALKGAKPTLPRLPASGADPAVAKLAAELRELERLNDRERELLGTRVEFLQDYYQQDLISIRDYFAARTAAADEALNAQIANIDKEVALLRARRGKDANETTQNEAKIKELIERRAVLQEKAGVDAIRRLNEQTEATKQLQRAIEDVNIELLEQQGLQGEAAGKRFDERNRALKQRLETDLVSAQEKGDGPNEVIAQRALKNLSALRSVTVAQGRLNELQDESGRIQSDLAIASDRAFIAAQNGSITELESLRAVSDARAQAAVDLRAVADAYAQVAAQTGNPALVQRAKEMQVEVERLASSADLVRDRFQDVFENGFESLFDRLASGTASIKDAFKSLFNEIASDLSKIAIKDLGQQLFSKNGAFGGVVDFTSQLFGGQSKAPVASIANLAGEAGESAARTASTAALTSFATVTTAADASLVTLATTTVATDTALVALTTSATLAASALSAAAAAAASSAASDSASGIIGLFGDFASAAAKGNIYAAGNLVPFANGGVPGIVDTPTLFPMSGGRVGLMGEAGPEAIMPLGRDKHGQLAVRMLNGHGVESFLPLARDAAGRLAVRAANDSIAHQKFAKGGVPGFRIPDATRFSTRSGAAMAIPVDSGRRGGGDTFITNVPQGTSQESASQIGARTAAAVQRANRRNN
jgi:hypothetical protein